MSMLKQNLLEFDKPAMQAYFEQLGERPYRAQQMLHWIHQLGQHAFEDMTNFGLELRAKLQTCAEIKAPQILHTTTSEDGTLKWLLRLADGNAIETVYIPEPHRRTLCVSSQVGCALSCQFCATARGGFSRNLSVSEIIGQLWLAESILRQPGESQSHITNVVFMGMGEPLLNDEAVRKVITIMRDDKAYGLSKYKITVSTAGVVPKIEPMVLETDVSLALSLHAPNNALRDRLVPINKKYPLETLIKVCERLYPIGGKRKITIEYVMLNKINDQLSHAKQLVDLLQHVAVKINLIPFNPFPGAPFTCSEPATIAAFQEYLVERGLLTIVRKTRGDDVQAACGQLVGMVQSRSRFKVRTMEEAACG